MKSSGPGQGPVEGPAMLELKAGCERCFRTLGPESHAFICSYECTFCPDCTATMDMVCPNCSGELVRRPRRREAGAS